MGRPAPVVGHAALLLRTRVGVGRPRAWVYQTAAADTSKLLQRVVVRTIQQLLAMFRRQGLPIVFTQSGSRAADRRDLPPFRRALLASRGPKAGQHCLATLSNSVAG